MRLLLDTHIALWAITAHPSMPARATKLMLEADAVFVSAASIWEISIKHALKPAQMSISGEQALDEFRAAGFSLLPIAERVAQKGGTIICGNRYIRNYRGD